MSGAEGSSATPMLLLHALLACSPEAAPPPAPSSEEVAPASPQVAPSAKAAPVAAEPSPEPVPADVGAPSADCAPGASINTKVSVAQRSVVVDTYRARASAEGEARAVRDRVTLAFAEVARVEHVHRTEPAPCHAIWLVLHDERRVLFDDDVAVDLSDRARRLGETLEVPVGATGPTARIPEPPAPAHDPRG